MNGRFGVDYQSPLVESIALSNTRDTIDIIRDEQPNLDRRDHSGRCPLDYCIPTRRDYSSYKDELSTAEAKLEGDDKYCRTGVCGVALLLLDNGASINLQDSGGWTVAHQCATIGHLPLLQLFVRGGADLNIRNKSGDRPLDIAVTRGHAPLVRYLEAQSGSLHCMCRMVIRDNVKPHKLAELPLPPSLKLFINYHIPYPGWTTPIVVPRPWSDEQLISGQIKKTDVQSFIEENASTEFLEERKIKDRAVDREELAELMEALYFWEAFKTIDYSEPLAPPPRYSMDHNNLDSDHITRRAKILRTLIRQQQQQFIT